MKSNIVINKKIYEKYKDDILPLSARLFCEPYFYDIANYNVPLDLKGLENFLSFTKEIEIYTTTTFIDFVNIIRKTADCFNNYSVNNLCMEQLWQDTM